MALLARQGMPTAVRSIHRDHVEAFIAAELERTAPSSAATRYRSLQQLFGWLDKAAGPGHRWRPGRSAAPGRRLTGLAQRADHPGHREKHRTCDAAIRS